MSRTEWGLLHDVVVLVVLTVCIGTGVWYWGYWVGKSDTLAAQVIAKEARK
jgi:hypothetical protein